ncbi:hypothetical protein [Pedobacter sp. JCM 36344]|uniref:hypothetical protein n=1 Tax=Pedobacter sp. JCM 36344 TaxID=3374280 RepID=UPI00397E5CB3
MESKEIFTLIEGKFDPMDALTLISTLFGTKIEYHNRNILRAHEGGTNHSQEDERVSELKKSRQAFQQKMREAIEHGDQVEIKSIIALSFVLKESQSVSNEGS